jgi:hypothetical protein
VSLTITSRSSWRAGAQPALTTGKGADVGSTGAQRKLT